MKKLIRRKVGDFLRRAWLVMGRAVDGVLSRKNQVIILASADVDAGFLTELSRRLDFFFPGATRTVHHKLSFLETLSRYPILILGGSIVDAGLSVKLRPNLYLIDWRSNPMDGWEWCRLAQSSTNDVMSDAVKKGKEKLLRMFVKLKQEFLSKRVYLFGTGPSLAHALDRDWSDGVRIVCNTIVKDRALWKHINPHLVVAGDAIYHFGLNEHSRQFRRDLLLRLQEQSTVLFVYPALFHQIVIREFEAVAEQLVPIPQGSDSNVFLDLGVNYSLPADANVLNLLLLPLAASIGKNIGLWGFDGRDPSAEFFWKNSGGQSYPDLMGSIRVDHPAFFEHLVPLADPLRYVRDVHGERLAKNIEQAKEQGYSVEMLHPTWTETLQRFYTRSETVVEYSRRILVDEAR